MIQGDVDREVEVEPEDGEIWQWIVKGVLGIGLWTEFLIVLGGSG